jgi:nucleotide-binding universal stress UspA family protein
VNKIKKILVPMDGSKNSFRGLDGGIYLARQCQAIITGLYVVPLSKPQTNSQISYVEKYLLTKAGSLLSKAKKRSAQNGILFEDKIEYGDEGSTITNFANKNSFDIIVIGSRGQSGIKEAFLGSTSNYVLHKSKIPVLIVK